MQKNDADIALLRALTWWNWNEAQRIAAMPLVTSSDMTALHTYWQKSVKRRLMAHLPVLNTLEALLNPVDRRVRLLPNGNSVEVRSQPRNDRLKGFPAV